MTVENISNYLKSSGERKSVNSSLIRNRAPDTPPGQPGAPLRTPAHGAGSRRARSSSDRIEVDAEVSPYPSYLESVRSKAVLGGLHHEYSLAPA